MPSGTAGSVGAVDRVVQAALRCSVSPGVVRHAAARGCVPTGADGQSKPTPSPVREWSSWPWFRVLQRVLANVLRLTGHRLFGSCAPEHKLLCRDSVALTPRVNTLRVITVKVRDRRHMSRRAPLAVSMSRLAHRRAGPRGRAHGRHDPLLRPRGPAAAARALRAGPSSTAPSTSSASAGSASSRSSASRSPRSGPHRDGPPRAVDGLFADRDGPHYSLDELIERSGVDADFAERCATSACSPTRRSSAARPTTTPTSRAPRHRRAPRPRHPTA